MGKEFSDKAEVKTATSPSAEAPVVAPDQRDVQEGQHLFIQSRTKSSDTVLDFGTVKDIYSSNNLIAQNPAHESNQGVGSDGKWHFQNPNLPPGQDLAASAKEWLWNEAPNLPANTAKGLVNGVWNVSVDAAETLNRHSGTNVIPEGAGMDYLTGSIKNPEKYNRQFRQIDPAACSRAYEAFGLNHLQVDKNLIPAIIWNEQLHRKPSVDDVQDLTATLGLPQKATESVGPAQMQLQNIRALAEKYPQLKQFGDPVKAAIQPESAPYFVAAYLADEIKNINAYNKEHSGQAGFQTIPINSDTIAYRYNPDVYRDKQGNHRSLAPWEKLAANAKMLHGLRKEEFPVGDVTRHSHHLQKIHQAMQEVKENGI